MKNIRDKFRTFDQKFFLLPLLVQPISRPANGNQHMVVIAPDILGIETTNRNRRQAPVRERQILCSAIFISHFLWWKGVYLLKHLKLDGAPLPVTARADEQSPLV